MLEDDEYDYNTNSVMGHDDIEIREEGYEEDIRDITIIDQFDGCSFTIPNHDQCTEIISVQIPPHTKEELWSMVNTQADQINFDQSPMDYEDNVDENHYTPYYSKSAVRIAEAVKDMQAKLGKFSLSKVADATNGGAIKNDDDFTRQQIVTADTILGTDISYNKGVFTEKQ